LPSSRLVVAGGDVFSGAGRRRLDVVIEDGLVAALLPPGGSHSCEVVDARGLWVLPGAIDVHVHGRDPGFPEKEDFGTLTAAAAGGGVTTVLDMPNTVPAVDTREFVEAKVARVRPKAAVDFGLYGLLRSSSTPGQLHEMAEAGVVAFKAYLGYALRRSTRRVLYSPGALEPDLEPPPDYDTVRRLALDLPALPLAAHCEDPALLLAAARPVERYADLLAARPAEAEATAIEAMAAALTASRATLHVAHLASAAGLEKVAGLKAAGATLTAETCPQYLWLTAGDGERRGARIKSFPLVRAAGDRAVLRRALLEGVIDVVATDHAPHTDAEKDGLPLADAAAGGPGVQWLLPSTLALAAGAGRPELAVRWLSENPARIFRLPGKGRLEPGYDADLALVDPAGETVPGPATALSRQRHSGLDGLQFPFAVRRTLLRGAEPIAGAGRFLRPT
jgi:dihydroorotase